MSQLTINGDTSSASISIKRPRFSALWQSYSEVGYMEAANVYELIGGEAAALRRESPDDYANACAMRMSRAFNYGNYKIPSGTIIKNKPIYRVGGSDGMPYIVRVNGVIDFLEFNWGASDLVMLPGKESEMQGKKGLIIIEVAGWSDARGHVVLWDGKSTSDGTDYHMQNSHAYDDPRVKLIKTNYWELKD